jgi:transaldolase/transaldolase/glucose-6-phosphate isomerase
MYIEELIGPDAVNTMPEETIMAYQDHGDPEPRLERGLDDARRVFEELAQAGIDYDDVTRTLEREGVEKFAASFDELMLALESKRGSLSAVA